MLLIFLIASFWIKDSISGPTPKFYDLRLIEEDEPELPDVLAKAIRNSTSCEQFLKNTTFDRRHILGFDWGIWYYWNHRYQDNYIMKFHIPSPMLITSFKSALEDRINPPVIWGNAILFMESSVGFSALFIKTDVDGLFRVIPTPRQSASTVRPEMLFAIKVIEPRANLAIMNCKYRLCYALAPINKFPDYLQCNQEAAKVGFNGYYGRCHIEPPFHSLLRQDRAMFEATEKEIITNILNQYSSDMECNCN